MPHLQSSQSKNVLLSPTVLSQKNFSTQEKYTFKIVYESTTQA